MRIWHFRPKDEVETEGDLAYYEPPAFVTLEAHKAAIAAEREACAKVCVELAAKQHKQGLDWARSDSAIGEAVCARGMNIANECAGEIRARAGSQQ